MIVRLAQFLMLIHSLTVPVFGLYCSNFSQELLNMQSMYFSVQQNGNTNGTIIENISEKHELPEVIPNTINPVHKI